MAAADSAAKAGNIEQFDHIRFRVGNAFQAASFYVTRFGFEPFAYSGLETGSRDVAVHVIRQNDIFFSFETALNPASESDAAKAMGAELMEHGDHAKDVAFTVDDCRAIHAAAVERGAVSTREPTVLKDDDGEVVIASVQTYGNVEHSFVERKAYKGAFLPGFRVTDEKDPLSSLVPTPDLKFIDHVVGNQPNLKMQSAVEWYEKMLGFHRFWSVDDKTLHTEYSSLRSVVVSSPNEKVKLPINEPAEGKRKSQIQEFVEYYGGAGVQHIALNTPDVINAVRRMRERGVKFLRVPDTYYKNLRDKLATASITVKEDLAVIEELGILCDFDDQGYLLQLFTKPQEDRPTLFFEIIQRNNHTGFGVGNFKSLFEAIERDQAERGNLQ